MYLKIDNYTDFELNINRTNKKEKNKRWVAIKKLLPLTIKEYQNILARFLRVSTSRFSVYAYLIK